MPSQAGPERWAMQAAALQAQTALQGRALLAAQAFLH